MFYCVWADFVVVHAYSPVLLRCSVLKYSTTPPSSDSVAHNYCTASESSSGPFARRRLAGQVFTDRLRKAIRSTFQLSNVVG